MRIQRERERERVSNLFHYGATYRNDIDFSRVVSVDPLLLNFVIQSSVPCTVSLTFLIFSPFLSRGQLASIVKSIPGQTVALKTFACKQWIRADFGKVGTFVGLDSGFLVFLRFFILLSFFWNPEWNPMIELSCCFQGKRYSALSSSHHLCVLFRQKRNPIQPSCTFREGGGCMAGFALRW